MEIRKSVFFQEAVAGPCAEAIELLCLVIHRLGIGQDGLFVVEVGGVGRKLSLLKGREQALGEAGARC